MENEIGGIVMKRDKSSNQIIRLDGKNVFLEVMNTAFDIGKVRINFVEYDLTQEKNNRIKQNIPVYINVDKFLLLANDVLSGRMAMLAKKAREEAQAKGYKYCKEIYVDLGGVSAKTLEQRGEARPDGMSLSRQFKITPGNKLPWILSAEMGAGEETETGLIAPKGEPEQQVRVPLSDDDFKRMFIIVKTHIEAYFAAQYLKSAVS